MTVRSFYQMEQAHNLILMLVVLLLVLASFRDFVAKFLQLTPPLLIKQESYSAVCTVDSGNSKRLNSKQSLISKHFSETG